MVFFPQGGLSSERTVIYLSALRKLAFKQKQIKEITKDSKSRDHRGGVFTVFFSTHSLARLYPMQLVVVMDVTSAVRMVIMMSIILFQVCFEF